MGAPGATLSKRSKAQPVQRVFKTAQFAKAASKADIGDRELCVAILQVWLGQADDLGGGVYKKRLGRNHYRSIIVTEGRGFWVYEYLFAKKDQANIDQSDLARLRKLAAAYDKLTDLQVERLIKDRDWREICNEQG
jgi:hypothetical protein